MLFLLLPPTPSNLLLRRALQSLFLLLPRLQKILKRGKMKID
jgi:hypothetical protein